MALLLSPQLSLCSAHVDSEDREAAAVKTLEVFPGHGFEWVLSDVSSQCVLYLTLC